MLSLYYKSRTSQHLFLMEWFTHQIIYFMFSSFRATRPNISFHWILSIFGHWFRICSTVSTPFVHSLHILYAVIIYRNMVDSPFYVEHSPACTLKHIPRFPGSKLVEVRLHLVFFIPYPPSQLSFFDYFILSMSVSFSPSQVVFVNFHSTNSFVEHNPYTLLTGSFERFLLCIPISSLFNG